MMSGREFRDAGSVTHQHWASDDQSCPRLVSGHRGKGTIKLVGDSRLHKLKLHAQRPSGTLRLAELLLYAQEARIPEYGHSGEARNRLCEELQSFASDVRSLDRQPCDIASRTRKARHKAGGN